VLGPFVDDGVGALVTSPMTQYDRSVSMSGHVMPGFRFFKSLRDNPQLLAKSSHVVPKSAVVSKEQSTPRATMEAAVAITAAGIPAANRIVNCIFVCYASKAGRNGEIDEGRKRREPWCGE
jgi:hypothetical protein